MHRVQFQLLMQLQALGLGMKLKSLHSKRLACLPLVHILGSSILQLGFERFSLRGIMYRSVNCEPYRMHDSVSLRLDASTYNLRIVSHVSLCFQSGLLDLLRLRQGRQLWHNIKSCRWMYLRSFLPSSGLMLSGSVVCIFAHT